MLKITIALTLLCIIPMTSLVSAEGTKVNSAHQVSRQTANYSGMEQSEFETQLKSSFAGTYAIYNGLPEKQKSEIYEAAANGTDVTKLRSMILASARKR